MFYPVMELIRELSYWPPNARTLTRNGALECLTKVLDTVHDLGDDLLPISIEILWNILEHGQKSIEDQPVALSRHELLDKHRYSNPRYVLGSEKSLITLTNLLLLFSGALGARGTLSANNASRRCGSIVAIACGVVAVGRHGHI